ncbi:hypothetical protein MMPV_002621 [Pyropia vietnamensis]
MAPDTERAAVTRLGQRLDILLCAVSAPPTDEAGGLCVDNDGDTAAAAAAAPTTAANRGLLAAAAALAAGDPLPALSHPLVVAALAAAVAGTSTAGGGAAAPADAAAAFWSAQLPVYVGALALLATFVRDNWTGPPLSPAVPDDVRLAGAADAVVAAAMAGRGTFLPAPAVEGPLPLSTGTGTRDPSGESGWVDLSADGEDVVRGVVRLGALSVARTALAWLLDGGGRGSRRYSGSGSDSGSGSGGGGGGGGTTAAGGRGAPLPPLEFPFPLAPWWAARAAGLQAGLLRGPAPSLLRAVVAGMERVLGVGAVLRPSRAGLLTDAAEGGVYGETTVEQPDRNGSGEDDALLPDLTFSEDDASSNGDDGSGASSLVGNGGSGNHNDSGGGGGDHSDSGGGGAPSAPAASTVAWLAAAAPDVLAMLWIEASHAARQVYDAEAAAAAIAAAANALRVRVRLSGALGVRTKYQVRSLAQLTAVVLRRDPAGGVPPNAVGGPPVDSSAATAPAAAMPPPDGDWPLPADVPLDDTDLLGYARLDGNGGADEPPADDAVASIEAAEAAAENAAAAAAASATAGGDAETTAARLAGLSPWVAGGALSPVEQAVVLSVGVAAASAAAGTDSMAVGERAAFAARVAAEASSAGGEASSMVLAHALLVRSDGEAARGRFQERVLAQTAAVADFVADPMAGSPPAARSAAAAERRRLAWASGLPLSWAVRLAHAQVLGRLGMVRSAMVILEALDFVDELIDCHTLLGESAVAEGLVRTRLASADGGDPRATAARPRLLCVLGDVTRSPLCYELAWRESAGRCARAQRALAAVATTDRRYGDAARHWEAALGVNALSPDGWFSLGVAHLSPGGGGPLAAARAFTRVVQQAPDHGQAWNNLGRALVECGPGLGPGGGSGSRDAAALSAMREAAKRLRDAPEVWDNVVTLAVRTGDTEALIGALDALMDLSGAAGVRGSALRAAADQVVARAAAAVADPRGGPPRDDGGGRGRTEASVAAARLCERLLRTLRTATGLVSSMAGVWDALAALHEGTPGGSVSAALEARRKALVATLATDANWVREATAWRRAAAYALRWAAAAVVHGEGGALAAAAGQLTSMLTQTAERWGPGGAAAESEGRVGIHAWAELSDARDLVLAELPDDARRRFRGGAGGDPTAAERGAPGGAG